MDADHELALLVLVWTEIERNAHQRVAVDVPVRRIEVAVVAAVCLHAALRADRKRAVIPLRDRLLPTRTPARRSFWNRMELDRPRASGVLLHHRAADEAILSAVEIAGVEIVEARAHRAGAHERIEHLAAREEHRRAGIRLVGVIASDDAFAGGWVVRRPHTGEQQ